MSHKNIILRKAEQVVPGLGKYILFFGAVVFLLLSGRLLMFTLESRALFQSIELSSSGNSYYVVTLSLAIYLVALSLLSLLGLFYEDDRIIKWFTFIACFNILVIDAAALLYVAPILTDNTNEMRQNLELMAPDYDWTREKVDPNSKGATNKWDTVQETYQCCGLYSLEDWASVRPPKLALDIYPASCCLKPQVQPEQLAICSANSQIFERGCLDEIGAINKTFIKLVAGTIWANIILVALGCIVIYSQRNVLDESREGYKLSRNTAAFLIGVIALCTIIQSIVISLRD